MMLCLKILVIRSQSYSIFRCVHCCFNLVFLTEVRTHQWWICCYSHIWNLTWINSLLVPLWNFLRFKEIIYAGYYLLGSYLLIILFREVVEMRRYLILVRHNWRILKWDSLLSDTCTIDFSLSIELWLQDLFVVKLSLSLLFYFRPHVLALTFKHCVLEF